MMIQSEKMLSVGGLAAGMAHEINNPLAGILQNAEVIKRRFDLDLPANRKEAENLKIDLSKIREYLINRNILKMLTQVQDSGKRASRIVKDMLSFSRKNDSSNAFYDIPDLIEKTIDLASKDYDLKKKFDFRNILIDKEYEKNIPQVPCNFSNIQQVFFNILKNGAQAMQENKKKKPKFMIKIKKEQEFVRIEIRDNGPGIPKENISRIFEPFFTTKDIGLGTGLGLSVSYFIINENHRGTMVVESESGKGANFIIRLPIKSS
jgi:polar amino acid transport system substrate-binding protein